jgi:hypothetical protein
MLKSRLSITGMLAASVMFSSAAMAENTPDMSAQINMLQQQIRSLQKQLDEVKATQHAQARQSAPVKTAKTKPAAPDVVTAEAAPAPAAEPKPAGILAEHGVKVTLGGFIEAAGIERSRNQTSDVGSSFNGGIPFPNSPNYHMNEFRGSSRQSRLSLLAQGSPDAATNLAAYFEADFLGAAPTANSNESNSYNPRLRQAYATLDRSDWGVHILGGQAWSLLTVDKKGMLPRQENVPLTIDAQYVPGFTWTRNTQARVVKDFDDQKIWAGISLESPQALIYNGPNAPSGSPNFNNPGTGQFAATNTYSNDVAPDLIAKLAFDPGYGHYEIYGVGRLFRDRNHFQNSTVMGGGAGAAAILPLIGKKLDFQLSGLAGTGIGRYGSTQLPDITITPDGGIKTVDSMQLLAGLVAHPDDKWDVYLYGGTERARKQAFASAGKGFGYGSSLYDNSGCETEGAAATSCVANTSSVSQLTLGAWWKFYHGSFGMMELGASDSYTRRNIFNGVGGSPNTDENIAMLSFRYYPF